MRTPALLALTLTIFACDGRAPVEPAADTEPATTIVGSEALTAYRAARSLLTIAGDTVFSSLGFTVDAYTASAVRAADEALGYVQPPRP